MKKIKKILIVVEGGDGSGKETQARLLISWLQKQGQTVAYFDFPRYNESILGALTGRALKGEFGDFRHLSPYLASLPYTLDRAGAKDALVSALSKGIVVCNRYTSSNVAFQSTKLRGKPRSDFVQFLEAAEYGELSLPRPNLVVYLHVPQKFSYALVAKKSGRKYLDGKKGARDQHEKDQKYQGDVIKTYLQLTKSRPEWKAISCIEGGQLLPPDQIHAKVAKVVSDLW